MRKEKERLKVCWYAGGKSVERLLIAMAGRGREGGGRGRSLALPVAPLRLDFGPLRVLLLASTIRTIWEGECHRLATSMPQLFGLLVGSERGGGPSSRRSFRMDRAGKHLSFLKRSTKCSCHCHRHISMDSTYY